MVVVASVLGVSNAVHGPSVFCFTADGNVHGVFPVVVVAEGGEFDNAVVIGIGAVTIDNFAKVKVVGVAVLFPKWGADFGVAG